MIYLPLVIFLAGVGWLIWRTLKEKADYDARELARRIAASVRQETAAAASGMVPQGESQARTRDLPSSQFGQASQGKQPWKM